MGHLSMNVSDSTVLSGLGAGHSLTSGRTPTRPFGWTWRWRAGRVRNSEILTSLPRVGWSLERHNILQGVFFSKSPLFNVILAEAVYVLLY